MGLVPISSNFCGFCGNMLRPEVVRTYASRICTKCKNRISISAKFCPICGEGFENRKELIMHLRFAWLKDMEKRCASDYTKFRVPELIEDEKEKPVFDKANKKAKDTNESVTIYVDLLERRGKIGSFPWALIRPDGTIEYIYE
jgi:hypothetical protein